MIPTLLLAGLIAGAVARSKVSILVGGVVVLAWGIIVGMADGSVSTFAGAVGLGAANAIVGAAIGSALRWTVERSGLAHRR